MGYNPVFAQKRLDDVQKNKIAYPRINKFLGDLEADSIRTFKDIRPSLMPDCSTVGFHVIDREYLVKDALENVWDTYVNYNLQEAWNTRRVQMGLAYSRYGDSLYYASDTIQTLSVGLIVFFNINLLLGIKDIAMAFEVTQVDSVQKLVEYSYIVGNGTMGKQQMFFDRTSKGYTLITHLSYYKSRPKTREGIYPHLHAELINQFHRNMKRRFQK